MHVVGCFTWDVGLPGPGKCSKMLMLYKVASPSYIDCLKAQSCTCKQFILLSAGLPKGALPSGFRDPGFQFVGWSKDASVEIQSASK